MSELPTGQQDDPGPLYPVIASYVERASAEDVGALYEDLKHALDSLKGARADKGKKVLAALGLTEQLLAHLLDVRQRLTSEKNAAKAPK